MNEREKLQIISIDDFGRLVLIDELSQTGTTMYHGTVIKLSNGYYYKPDWLDLAK